MANELCKDVVLREFPELSDKQDILDDMIQEMEKRPDLRNVTGELDPVKVDNALNKYIDDKVVEATRRAANEAIDVMKYESVINKIDKQATQLSGQNADFSYAELIESLLVGYTGKYNLEGGKDSIEMAKNVFANEYQIEFVNNIEDVVAKHGEVVKPLLGISGNILGDAGRWMKDVANKELTKARAELNHNINVILAGGEVEDALAKDVAKVIDGMRKKMAMEINELGGDIPLSKVYLPDNHNAYQILISSKEDWVRAIKDAVDFDSTLKDDFLAYQGSREYKDGVPFRDSEVVETFINRLYNDITSGVKDDFQVDRMKPLFGAKDIPDTRGVKLRYTSPEAYASYVDVWGNPDAMASTMTKILSGARQKAAMSVLGSNPAETLDTVKKHYVKKLKEAMPGDKKGQDKIIKDLNKLKFSAANGTGRIGEMFSILMGYSDSPINYKMAKVSGTIRALERLKLGGAAITAIFGDLFTMGIQKGRIRGTRLTPLDIITSLFDRIDWRDKDVVRQLNLEAEEYFGATYNRFDSPYASADSQQLANRVTAAVMRYSGLNAVTENARHTAQRTHMRMMGERKDVPFRELPEMARKDISAVGIKEEEWDVMRVYAEKADSGYSYLLPDNMMKMSNKDIDRLFDLSAFRGKEKDAMRNEHRRELARKLKKYYILGDRYAVIQADDRTKWWSTFGTRPGTAKGEAARAFMQFKMQPVGASTQAFRERRFGGASFGFCEIAAASGSLVGMTMVGYSLIATKDILSGKTPPDITKPSVWMRSLAAGGALGYVFDTTVDFASGEVSFLEMFGPIGGDIEKGAKVAIKAATEASKGEKADVGAVGTEAAMQSFRVAKGLIPNIWYTKWLTDYYFTRPIEETIKPGTDKRRRGYMKRESGQEWLTRRGYFQP